jgi:hypothetical protein
MPTDTSDLLAEVRRDIESLEAKLTELRSVERWLADKSNTVTIFNTTATVDTFQARDNRAVPHRNWLVNTGRAPKLKDLAFRVMTDLGRPLTTRILADKLLQTGLAETTNQEGFPNALYSALSRDKERFRRTEDGKWELLPDAKEEA